MVKAKKHLGQHFLRNDGIARDIAEGLSHQGYTKVLEIGPGTGVLSHFLLEGLPSFMLQKLTWSQ
jgi:16S rRNA (adenine1518-N6/adenine1519-N6)-dimethyltransferase